LGGDLRRVVAGFGTATTRVGVVGAVCWAARVGQRRAYSGSQPLMLPSVIAGPWSVLMGLGLVVWSAAKRTRA